MNYRPLRFLTLPAVTLTLLAPIASQAQFGVTDLITDMAGVGTNPVQPPDGHLLNPWGISSSPTGSPFWIADNNSGFATLYNSVGVPQALTVTIPLPAGVNPPPPATPTGNVFAGGQGFAIAPGNNALFIFATEDGTISAWSGGTSAVRKVDNSTAGAVYKGLAIGNNGTANFIYAANFNSGHIDVFNTSFAPAALPGAFIDPSLPAGYAPFGIQNIGGKLYVTYALQDGAKHDDVPGAGNGLIDVYDTNGNFLQRFATGTSVGGTLSQLNSPWGLDQAPVGFGNLAGDLLVGNFRSGNIDIFNPSLPDGSNFLGQLKDLNGNIITLDGLWGLINGNGGNGGDKTAVYFTAGANDEADGIFGRIQATPEPGAYATFLLGGLTLAGYFRRRSAKKR